MAFLVVVCLLLLPALAGAQAGPVGAAIKVWTYAGATVRWPDIAYDPENRVYLNVFGFGGRIVGLWADSSGNIVGTGFGITNGAIYAQTPRAAYSPDAHGFLVTWHSSDTSQAAVIRGQIVKYSSPQASGVGAVISDSARTTFWEQAPAVAYSPASQRFLVAWPEFDSGGNKDIRGRLVDNTGQAIGSGIVLTGTRNDNDRDPAVGYIPDTDTFLVAFAGWNNPGSYSYLRTQVVKPDGTLGASAQLAQSLATYIPEIAYNSVTHQILVGWAQNDPSSGGAIRLFGHLLDPAGALVGTANRFAANFGAYDAQGLAYNPIAATFFMVTHGRGNEDAGVELNAAGIPVNSGYGNLTATGSVKGTFNPRIATNGCTASWVVNTAEAYANLYTQLVTAPNTNPLGACIGVGVAPAVTTHPSNVTASAGATATFTADATGDPTPSVQWQVSANAGSTWSGISGATSATYSFTVAGTDHGKKYRAMFSNTAGTKASNAATLTVDGAVNASPQALRFSGVKANAAAALTNVTPGQTVTLTFSGTKSGWTATSAQTWLQITGGSGTGPGQFKVDVVNPSNVVGGSTTLTGSVTITGPSLPNSPMSIPVTLTITAAGTSTVAPFGVIDIPANGSTGVVGSIAVGGWALDDVGVANVRIYRNCLSFDAPASCQVVGGINVVYIGDAAFVSGARPDVEAAFPTYPQAQRGGWGYLLLTNMLPDVPGGKAYGGQGAITLYAIATDVEGKITVLGRSGSTQTATTITLANASINKPFGAIDTPSQGQAVSGVFTNFGWALTPDADAVAGAGDILIPPDGSTVLVYIDGIAGPSVTFNQCRGDVGNPVPLTAHCNDDVASIFGHTTPQPVFTPRTSNPTVFRNLDQGRGVIGSYSIDTTLLTDGLHSIAWSVTDSAGRVAGIGSRNFTVLNAGAAGARRSQAADATRLTALQDAPARPRGDARVLARLPQADVQVRARSGFDPRSQYDEVTPDSDGVRRVQVPVLGRLELRLGVVQAGYLAANGTLRDLPPGSALDTETGAFTWVPIPGYVGTYHLVFLCDGSQVAIDVTLRPIAAAAPGESEIRMNVDLPAAGQILGGAVLVAGWALDPQAATGSGIGAVHVWARRRDAPTAGPVFLGAATLGASRPDVARAFGAQFGSAGFSVSTTALDPGQYDVTVYAWNRRTARWEDARTVNVTVR